MNASTRIIALACATIMLTAAITSGGVLATPFSVSGSAPSASPGASVTVSFDITNQGNASDAAVLTITDLPAGWNVTDGGGDGNFKQSSLEFIYFSVGSGSSKASTITVDIPSNASAGEYNISATVKDGSNTVVDSTTVTVSVESTLELTSDDESGLVGQNTSVSFTVENNGDSEATGAALKFTTLPSGWSVVESSGDGTYKSSTREFAYVSIGAGSSVSSTLKLSIPDNAQPGKYTVSAELNTSAGTISTLTTTVKVGKDVNDAYDQDSNGAVETGEMLDGVKDWREAGLDTSELLQLINAWKSG